MILLFGHDTTVAEWASSKFGRKIAVWNYALGVLDRDGALRGAATFHDWNGSNIEVSYWGPWTLRLSVVCGIARFCFVELGANRITARTPRSNKIMTRHLRKLGFRHEGVSPVYYGPRRADDAVIFGLLARDAGRLLRDRQ